MALRCAVWISNVIQASHQHQELKYAHEYRTLAKVRVLDHAYDGLWAGDHKMLNEMIPNERENSVEGWATFGNTHLLEHIKDVPLEGRIALQRVLYALETVLGVEYAPMIPIIAMICLGAMSESYAFTCIREMAHHSTWFWPCSVVEHHAHKRTFLDVLGKLHPTTAQNLEYLGVGDDLGEAIFRDFFTTIFQERHVLRIMDIYSLEGSKVLFRFGVALAVLYHKEWKQNGNDTQSPNDEDYEKPPDGVLKVLAEEWWAGLKTWAHSSAFDFELMLKKAYGVHGRGVRKRFRFPRRPILQRILKLEEERYYKGRQDQDDDFESTVHPLGMAQCDTKEAAILQDREMTTPKLAVSTHVRTKLAQWLPMSLKMTNLRLIYSTNHHGRTLDNLYRNVRNAKHTITLIEPLSGSDTIEAVGMYASQTWVPSTKVYGDGSCFLFRLSKTDDAASISWKWTPKTDSIRDVNVLEEEGVEQNNETALLEQFQVSTHSYLSMGGNENGTSGLRLNEDLTKGESSPAAGFGNEPLVPGNELFEVGLVEVYELVRSIDGVPIA